MLTNLSKSGVPNPVTCIPLYQRRPRKKGSPKPPLTGSHPASAGNPSVPQPGLLPDVTSLSAPAPVEYRNGFMKPIAGFPAAMRRSLRSAATLAKSGVLALVPDTGLTAPPMFTWYATPCAATSGYARPAAVNRPAFVSPRMER